MPVPGTNGSVPLRSNRQEDSTFALELYEMLAGYEQKLETATRRSSLPDEPDMKKVEAFVEHVNRQAIGNLVLHM